MPTGKWWVFDTSVCIAAIRGGVFSSAYRPLQERLYRLRYLRRGTHRPRPAIAFVRLLRLSLGPPRPPDTS